MTAGVLGHFVFSSPVRLLQITVFYRVFKQHFDKTLSNVNVKGNKNYCQLSTVNCQYLCATQADTFTFHWSPSASKPLRTLSTQLCRICLHISSSRCAFCQADTSRYCTDLCQAQVQHTTRQHQLHTVSSWPTERAEKVVSGAYCRYIEMRPAQHNVHGFAYVTTLWANAAVMQGRHLHNSCTINSRLFVLQRVSTSYKVIFRNT